MPSKRTSQHEIPDYGRVKKYSEYWDFIIWISTPTLLRKQKSQRDFAREHSIHETTLSKWRRMPEFRQDVIRKVAELLHEDTADVMYSLRNRIFKDGSAAEVKLFLEWVTKWMPEIKVTIEEDEGDSETLMRKLAKEFEAKLAEALSKKDGEDS